MKPMKTEPESTEYSAFKSLLGRVLAVPHTEIVHREGAYQAQSKLNPNRRGPKPKRKRGAGRAPHA
jgi:hypothetical protein